MAGVDPGGFSRCDEAAQPARPSITKASAMRRQAIPVSDPFIASGGQVSDIEFLFRLCAANPCSRSTINYLQT
jgi:hypothetical protein